MRKFLLALLLAVPLVSVAAPITNQDVIALVRGGLGEVTILQAIDTSEPAFDTSATGLLSLKNAGVSDLIIQRILARAQSKPHVAPTAAASAAAGGPAPATQQQPVAAQPVPQQQPAPPQQVAAAPHCPDCGTVLSLREIDRPGQASGVGAVTGGLLGGVLGRQIGGDRTGTVIGAVGGAVAGHQIEKHAKSGKLWEISVRFSDGTRTYTHETHPGVAPGDRVRVVNGALVRQ